MEQAKFNLLQNFQYHIYPGIMTLKNHIALQKYWHILHITVTCILLYLNYIVPYVITYSNNYHLLRQYVLSEKYVVTKISFHKWNIFSCTT